MRFTPLSTIFQLFHGMVEETGLPGEHYRPIETHCQTLSLNVVSTTPRLSGVRTYNVSGARH